MKRSRINHLIRDAEAFFATRGFHLPPWAHWTPADWSQRGDPGCEVVRNALGWDLTDFGSGEFERTGLLLFTLRNGQPGVDRKPYAEKIMIVGEGQRTPLHFHWQKMEDIINRGGGNLELELRLSASDESPMDGIVEVMVDGLPRFIPPGERVVLEPGESICLPPGLYHAFQGQSGGGPVLVGEVSMVNDDHHDNRFYPPVGRFPDIEEDEEPYRLLVTDYACRL